MVEMKEAKKAADVVKEVTHMVSIEWPKADPTIDSKWSSRELKLGSILEWALQALTKMKVSSAPTPIKRKRSFVNCRQVVLKKKVTRFSVGYEQCSSSPRRISSIVCRNISALCTNDKCAHYNTKVALFGKERTKDKDEQGHAIIEHWKSNINIDFHYWPIKYVAWWF